MPPLRCCSYNCRGWNSGELFLNDIIDSHDLIFLQEHWLIDNQLHKINNFHQDFLSVSVSAMNGALLHAGRPFGGCSIIYRKSLSSSITPLSTASDRFCAIKVCDSSNCHFLLCSVYLPNEYHPSSYTDYLNKLGELHGLISSQAWDGIYLIGGFN